MGFKSIRHIDVPDAERASSSLRKRSLREVSPTSERRYERSDCSPIRSAARIVFIREIEKIPPSRILLDHTAHTVPHAREESRDNGSISFGPV